MLNIEINNFEIHTTNMKINNVNQEVICISFEADELPAIIKDFYDVNQVNYTKNSLSATFTDGNKENDITIHLKQNAFDNETFELFKKYKDIIVYGSENHNNNGFSFLAKFNHVEPQHKIQKGRKPF